MTPSPGGAVASVRQRLLNRARERDENYNYTLSRYGVERFLYRLGRSRFADQYVVKGSTLFLVWLDQPYRPTRDLDMSWLGTGSAEQLEQHLLEIFSVPCPEDGLEFPERIQIHPIRQGEQTPGLRAEWVVKLGAAPIKMQLDLGVGDAIHPPPAVQSFPRLLTDLPEPVVSLYPKETFVAEKFESMVRQGPGNTRYKDFSDVTTLASHFRFEGPGLCRAVEETFRRCGRELDPHDRPAALTATFYSSSRHQKGWKSFAAQHPSIEGLGPFQRVGDMVIEFLEPIWQAAARKQDWQQGWEAGGPWT